MEKKTGTVILPAAGRIDSIDIIRGLTILVMIFVNDVGGVSGTPAWMQHMPTFTDGMTFVDLVFPGFLFIVGMSVPFSIGRRLNKEKVYLPTLKHITARSFALIVLGFYMVNGDSISENGILNSHLWILLMYIAAIIIWSRSKTIRILQNKPLKMAAVILLIVLAFIYKGNDGTGFIQMRPQWWGILGLIGWSYLISVLLYIPFRNNQLVITGNIVLLYLFFMAGNAGLNLGILNSVLGLGSHSAIIMSGILLGTEIDKNAGQNHLLNWGAGFGLFLFLSGYALHQLNYLNNMFIISKNLATVPWSLFSSAITVWAWIIIYWLVDIKNINTGMGLLKNAGMNPLFAYILAPLLIEIVVLLSLFSGGFNFYWWLGESFWPGFIRAIIIAFSMTWLAGFLSRKGFLLKL